MATKTSIPEVDFDGSEEVEVMHTIVGTTQESTANDLTIWSELRSCNTSEESPNTSRDIQLQVDVDTDSKEEDQTAEFQGNVSDPLPVDMLSVPDSYLDFMNFDLVHSDTTTKKGVLNSTFRDNLLSDDSEEEEEDVIVAGHLSASFVTGNRKAEKYCRDEWEDSMSEYLNTEQRIMKKYDERLAANPRVSRNSQNSTLPGMPQLRLSLVPHPVKVALKEGCSGSEEKVEVEFEEAPYEVSLPKLMKLLHRNHHRTPIELPRNLPDLF